MAEEKRKVGRPKTVFPPALEKLRVALPDPYCHIHGRLPRQTWRDFQEVAALHHRSANQELLVAMKEYLRWYKSDLSASRKAAVQED